MKRRLKWRAEHECLTIKEPIGPVEISEKLLRKISSQSWLSKKGVKKLIKNTIRNGDDYYLKYSSNQLKNVRYKYQFPKKFCENMFGEGGVGLNVQVGICHEDNFKHFKVCCVHMQIQSS